MGGLVVNRERFAPETRGTRAQNRTNGFIINRVRTRFTRIFGTRKARTEHAASSTYAHTHAGDL